MFSGGNVTSAAHATDDVVIDLTKEPSSAATNFSNVTPTAWPKGAPALLIEQTDIATTPLVTDEGVPIPNYRIARNRQVYALGTKIRMFALYDIMKAKNSQITQKDVMKVAGFADNEAAYKIFKGMISTWFSKKKHYENLWADPSNRSAKQVGSGRSSSLTDDGEDNLCVRLDIQRK